MTSRRRSRRRARRPVSGAWVAFGGGDGCNGWGTCTRSGNIGIVVAADSQCPVRRLHRHQRITRAFFFTAKNSKIKFCEALREAGARVDHTFVVFYYDIFPETKKSLKKIGLEMHSLATWWDVLKVAKEYNYFDNKAIGEVESFLNNPVKWSADHGGEIS